MKRLTLTLDNGPEPAVTHAVLDVLNARGVTASFFVVGSKLAEEGGFAAAARAHAEGHRVGNHSNRHETPLGWLDPLAAIAEIERVEALLKPLNRSERLFRPYAGGGVLHDRLFSRAAYDHLIASGFTCVLWNAVPRDWIEPDQWVERALREIAAQDWTVLVLHDIASGAMAHLDRFLGAVIDRGVEIVADYAPDCVPIRRGKAMFPIDQLIYG